MVEWPLWFLLSLLNVSLVSFNDLIISDNVKIQCRKSSTLVIHDLGSRIYNIQHYGRTLEMWTYQMEIDAHTVLIHADDLWQQTALIWLYALISFSLVGLWLHMRTELQQFSHHLITVDTMKRVYFLSNLHRQCKLQRLLKHQQWNISKVFHSFQIRHFHQARHMDPSLELLKLLAFQVCTHWSELPNLYLNMT